MTEKQYRPTKAKLRELQRDLRRLEKRGKPLEIADLHRTIGHHHEAMEQYAEALAAYQKALAIHKTLADEEEILTDLANIANYYRHTNQLREAATRLRSIIRKADKASYEKLVVASRLNLAYVHAQSGDGDGAINLLERVVEEARRAQMVLTERQALAFLGQVYLSLEEFFLFLISYPRRFTVRACGLLP